MLSEQMLSLLQESCSEAFIQKRSCIRAMELSLGTLCALGRRTLSRSICAVGRQRIIGVIIESGESGGRIGGHNTNFRQVDDNN